MITRSISEREFRAGLAQLTGPYRSRNRALLIGLAKTGFRISELLSVQVKDVYDAVSGAMRPRISISRQHMKGKIHGRTIPVHSEAQQAIHAWIIEGGLDQPGCGSLPLFKSRKGGRLTRGQAWRVVKSAFRRSGTADGVACHSMRKKYGTEVYERSGRCIATTQQALGHRDPTHTAVYIDINRERLEAAILGLSMVA